ncbi:MAG: hypothetical protein EHM72_05450 [Calditrichaeota bacterium]|nr:MAG: hypothetical protein EHM72_05450 [Calditrichota bacterium]
MGIPPFEFSTQQNSTFGSLAGKMKLVSIFFIVIGVLSAMSNWVQGSIVAGVINAAVFIFIGIWTLDAGRAFRRIVDTQGSDISHLMSALVNLKRLYTLQFWLLIITMIAVLVLIGFLLGGSMGARLQDFGSSS